MNKNTQTKTEQLRSNPYIISTIVLGILVIILVINSLIHTPIQKMDLCSIISGTPAWIQDGKVIDYGFKGNISVDDLIINNVEFYYRVGCGYCELQINSFDNWTKYKESGLTKECK